MKGRILFALLFAALLALGITSLSDLQSERAALPPPQRAQIFVPALPTQLPEKDSAVSSVLSPCSSSLHAHAAPPDAQASAFFRAPALTQSYHRAFYQAFHFSDRAG